jgi:hypothetical protein
MNNPPPEAKDSSSLAKWLIPGMVVTAMAGIMKLGMIPVVIAGLLAWALGSHLSKLIGRKIQSNAIRTIMGLASILVMFFLSVTAGLLAPKITQVAPQAASQVAPQQNNSGDAITLEALKTLAQEQNRNVPVKTSPSVELTKVHAGPGLMLTYNMRILVEHDYSASDLNGIKIDAIHEGCKNFKPGLEAGVTYVLAYHRPNGSALLSIPISNGDCPTAESLESANTIGELVFGSSLKNGTNEIERPTDVLKPNETLFISVPTNFDIPRKASITVSWKHVDTGQSGMKNSSFSKLHGAESHLFKFAVPGGWARGNYELDVSLDGKPSQKRAFKVQ